MTSSPEKGTTNFLFLACVIAVTFLLRFVFALLKEIGHRNRTVAVRTLAAGHIIGFDPLSTRRAKGQKTGRIAIALLIATLTTRVAQSQTTGNSRSAQAAAATPQIFIVTATSLLQAQTGAPIASSPKPSASVWQYGGFVDFGYLRDFNDPANHLFRSRGTAFRVDEPNLDMAALYLRKAANESSRWGSEFTLQTGTDSEVFGYSATAPNLDGSRGLRHLGPTDVSYLVPVGKGLTLQGGIFSSFIGYDSLYAKDNFNYTRPWGADFTPYLMMGGNAQYPITPKLTATAFLISGYWHLALANNLPTMGGQLADKVSNRLNLKETLLYGPHQSDTSLEFWRFFSDGIVEWKPGPATIAFEYQIGEEKVATIGTPRALWMSSQLPMHWAFDRHWSATLRPEVAWDRNGRWTGFSQTVKAVTSTLEYRIPYRAATGIVRLEHRWDDSPGPQGGFFIDGDASPGVPKLTPSQQLFLLGVIVTFDSSFRH